MKCRARQARANSAERGKYPTVHAVLTKSVRDVRFRPRSAVRSNDGAEYSRVVREVTKARSAFFGTAARETASPLRGLVPVPPAVSTHQLLWTTDGVREASK